MKKRLTLIVLVLICALALSACGCKHETWNEASCEAPKTCSTCGKTEGEALGHAWVNATTETPQTCETCGKTEGERIITDERFTTAATIDYQGKWVTEFKMSGALMDLPDFEAGFNCYLILELCHDGTLTLTIEAVDIAVCEQDMTGYLVEALYAELAAGGYDKAAADEAFYEAYGMTLEEYAGYAVKEMDLPSIFELMRVDMVYYIEGSNLYMGENWLDLSMPSPISLDGDTLIVEEDLSALGIEGDKLVFTRVAEE